MAIFEVSIRKTLATNSLFAWSNVYHVEAASLSEATLHGNDLVAVERQIHNAFVAFHSVHIKERVVAAVGVTIPLSGLGQWVTVGDALPAFVAVRVDLVPSAGRTGRKFYHVLVTENMQADGILDEAARALIQAAFDEIMPDFSAILTDPTGTFFYTDAIVSIQLTQHQFKRKWARRGVPPG
jgi:hypothetical protein